MRKAVVAVARTIGLAVAYCGAFAVMVAAIGAIWGMELARRVLRARSKEKQEGAVR